MKEEIYFLDYLDFISNFHLDFVSVWVAISELLEIFKFLWAFYKIDKFVIDPSERCLWSSHLHFFENKQRIRAYVDQVFILGWKFVDYTANLRFSSRVR